MFHANLFNAGIFGVNRHHASILIWQNHHTKSFSNNNFERYSKFRVWSDYQYAPKIMK
jgi:hypothetical protein